MGKEKYYGILMERKRIKSQIYIYIPKHIIRGTMKNEACDISFEDENGKSYFLADDVDGIFNSEDEVVYFTVSDEELLSQFPGKSLHESKNFYYSDKFNKIYLGFYVERENRIAMISCSTDEILNGFNAGESMLSMGLSGDEMFSTVDTGYLAIESSNEELSLDYSFNPIEGIPTKKKVLSFFEHIFEELKKANDVSQIEEIQRTLSIQLVELINYLKRYIDEETVQAISNFVYNFVDRLSNLSERGLFVLKCEIELFEQTEQININNFAELFSKFSDEEEELNSVMPKIDSKVKTINVRDMKDFFDYRVIEQESAKRALISAVAMNSICKDDEARTSCLLIGPTGSGKTLLVETLKEYTSLPMVIFDTNQLTAVGYIGASPEDVLARLLDMADGDVEIAEKGIVVFDEIDKKATEKNSDIAGRAVLNALLSFMQGTDYKVKYNDQIVNFNTSRLTILATGAFANVAELKNMDSRPIGFGSDILSNTNQDISYAKISPIDLVKYGKMPGESVGRFTTIVQLNGQTKSSLINILTKAESSVLLSTKRKLERIGIELKWTETYLDAVASKALKLKTGARALNSIVEETVSPSRWEVLYNPDKYKGILLTEQTVEDAYNCQLIGSDGTIYNLKNDLISGKESEKLYVKRNITCINQKNVLS